MMMTAAHVVSDGVLVPSGDLHCIFLENLNTYFWSTLQLKSADVETGNLLGVRDILEVVELLIICIHKSNDTLPKDSLNCPVP